MKSIFFSTGYRLAKGFLLILSCLFTLASQGNCPMLTEEGLLWQKDIFIGGNSKPEGYRLFRLPSIFSYGPKVLLFAEGRENSRNDPGKSDSIDIVYKISDDYGKNWGSLQVLADGTKPPSGISGKVSYQPTTVYDASREYHRLFVFYNRDSSKPFYRYTEDFGKTWSKEMDLLKIIKNAPKSYKKLSVNLASGVQLQDGNLVIPTNTILATDKGDENRPSVVYSKDHGETWYYGGHARPGANEHQITEVFTNGASRLYSISRRNGPVNQPQNRRINYGIFNTTTQQWDWGDNSTPLDGKGDPILSTAVSTGMIRYTRADENFMTVNRLLLTLPLGKDSSGTLIRKDLYIYVSEDEGHTYDRPRLLASGLAAYSAIANVDDDCFLVAWERGKEESYEFITLTAANQSFLDKR